MQISTTFLVALMFVTILTLGIANLLVALAAVVGNQVSEKRDWILTAWKTLMLLIYLNVFWHTSAILSVEGWGFAGFLYIIAGPVLLFFSVSLLLAIDNSQIEKDRNQFTTNSQRFFQLLAIIQIWIIGSDLLLGRGFLLSSFFNLALMSLALVLMLSKHPKPHKIGIIAAWLIVLSTLGLRGLGVIV
jgi:hypothetical protein